MAKNTTNGVANNSNPTHPRRKESVIPFRARWQFDTIQSYFNLVLKKATPMRLSWMAFAAILLFSSLAHAKSRNVDPDIFRRSVDRQMQNRVKGYAFAIADKTGVIAEAWGGWAQDPDDGKLRMSPTVPIGMGSNQKVLSGVALLDLLEKRSAPVSQQLESPIYFFLPDKWVEIYFRGSIEVPKDWIRLRDILDHTSGLAQEKDSGGSQGPKIARALAAPMLTVAFKTNRRDYNNNFTLLMYIIPNLAYPKEVRVIEEGARNMALADYNIHIAREYGKLYTRYMLEQFLPRVPVPVTGTCRPGDLRGKRYAKQYSSRTSKHGYTDDVEGGFCRAQGSWSYSVRDFAEIWRTMEFSNDIVSRSTRKLYPASSSPRLIYWRGFSNPLLKKDTAKDVYRGHGGRTPSLSGSPQDNDRANSVGIRLPWGHVGIAAVNSDELRWTKLAPILMTAFYEATRETYEKDTDRGGSDIEARWSFDPSPEVCASFCDQSSVCKAWTYVPPGVQHDVLARCWLKNDIPAKNRRTGLISGVKGLEYGFDRPGSNFKKILLPKDDAAACRVHCAFNSQCKAWTFVKAGVQGNKAVCWLKKTKPARRKSDFCVSGVR